MGTSLVGGNFISVGLVLLNTPNTNGNARTRGVIRGCNVPTMSANGVVHTTLGTNARVKLGTGSFVSTNRLIPSSIIVNVVGSELRRGSYRGKFVLSNFPHAVPRTRTLRSVNISVSGILSVRIPSRGVATEVSNHHMYSGYTGSCRLLCGGPGARNIYSTYNNRLVRHGSSTPRAIRTELGRCRRVARPLGSFCGGLNGLIVIRNRRRITSAATLIFGTLRSWRSDTWGRRET